MTGERLQTLTRPHHLQNGRRQTFIAYLHWLALQQGKVKGYPAEEGLPFVTLNGPQAAGRGLAQKLFNKDK